MSESIRLKQDEQIQELMGLVETLQKEGEDKDKVIAEQGCVLEEQGKVIEEQTGLIAEQKMQLQECLVIKREIESREQERECADITKGLEANKRFVRERAR